MRKSSVWKPSSAERAYKRLAPVLSPVFPFGPTLDLTTDGAGAFEIPRLPVGLYKITAEQEGFAPATVDVQVPPGAVAAVEIELRP